MREKEVLEEKTLQTEETGDEDVEVEKLFDGLSSVSDE